MWNLIVISYGRIFSHANSNSKATILPSSCLHWIETCQSIRTQNVAPAFLSPIFAKLTSLGTIDSTTSCPTSTSMESDAPDHSGTASSESCQGNMISNQDCVPPLSSTGFELRHLSGRHSDMVILARYVPCSKWWPSGQILRVKETRPSRLQTRIRDSFFHFKNTERWRVSWLTVNLT